MARVFTFFEVILLLFVLGSCISENEAISNNSILIPIPIPTNGRIQALQGRKCLNFLWDSASDHPSWKVTLKIKLKRNGGSSSVTQEISSYKPTITNNNASYAQCLYDTSARENVSCCNSINSGLNFASGESIAFSNFEEISFDIRICNNDSGLCLLTEGFGFVLPWYNLCLLDKPCQNYARCNPAVNMYNCSCGMGWKGDNCSVPEDMTYKAGKCLDYSSNADVKQYMKTVAECRTACANLGSSKCKIFEFKKMSSGNHGNCTLHDANSLDNKVVPCAADLYEFTRYLNPSSGSTLTIVTFHLLFMFLATIFLSE